MRRKTILIINLLLITFMLAIFTACDQVEVVTWEDRHPESANKETSKPVYRRGRRSKKKSVPSPSNTKYKTEKKERKSAKIEDPKTLFEKSVKPIDVKVPKEKAAKYAKLSKAREINAPRPGGKADLSVAYVERYPKYERYRVSYLKDQSMGPYPCKDDRGPVAINKDKKHYPDEGEYTAFFAHVMNQGGKKSGEAKYRWFIDGVPVKEGTIKPLSPNEEIVERLDWNWKKGVHKVKFALLADDPSQNNNLLEDRIDGYYLQIYVDRPLYERFAQKKNLMGTYSFEDWLQAQSREMNAMFKRSVYPVVAPEGVKEGFRIDRITLIEKDKGHDRDYLFDGEWRFRDVSQWPDVVINKIDRGLLHEWCHQISLPDLYQMNLVWERNLIKDPNGNTYLRQLMQPKGGLMGGGSIEDYGDEDRPILSSHSAAALNISRGKRAGFFGDYVWDTPKNTKIIILNDKGQPIPGAKVSAYPFNEDTEEGKKRIGLAAFFAADPPRWTKTSDSEGIITLPNVKVTKKGPTARGHSLRDNPFGDLDVGTNNGVLFLKVESEEQIDLTGVYLWQLNLAYWKGSKDTALIPIKTKIGSEKTGWEPREVKVTPALDTAEIEWESILHAPEYYVYVGEKPNPSAYARGVKGTGRNPKVNVGGLKQETEYYYQITANSGSEIHPVAYSGTFKTK